MLVTKEYQSHELRTHQKEEAFDMRHTGSLRDELE